jgi:ribosome-associated translation inhibitor RaiA
MEITYRGVEKTQPLEQVIRKKAAKLEPYSGSLVHCRVALDAPRQGPKSGNPCQVRIHMTFPNRQVVVKREASKGEMHEQLDKVLGSAFDAALRQLKRMPTARSPSRGTAP